MAESLCADLVCLDANDENLNSETLKELLSREPRLYDLSIDCNSLRDEDIQILGFNSTIKKLSLFDNLLGPGAGECLARNTTITSLNISQNKLGDEGVAALMQNNTTITDLDITNNDVFDTGIVASATCPSLKTFALMQLDDDYREASDVAVAAMARNTTITKLYLRGYGELTQFVLLSNTTVNSLDLRGCGFRPGVGDALLRNTRITSLSLESIGDAEAKILAKQQSVADLHIYTLEMSEETALALTRNTCLASLDVDMAWLTSSAALHALLGYNVLMSIGFMTSGILPRDEELALRRCVTGNRNRARRSARVFVIAVTVAFKLKAAMLKRLRSQ